MSVSGRIIGLQATHADVAFGKTARAAVNWENTGGPGNRDVIVKYVQEYNENISFVSDVSSGYANAGQAVSTATNLAITGEVAAGNIGKTFNAEVSVGSYNPATGKFSADDSQSYEDAITIILAPGRCVGYIVQCIVNPSVVSKGDVAFIRVEYGNGGENRDCERAIRVDFGNYNQESGEFSSAWYMIRRNLTMTHGPYTTDLNGVATSIGVLDAIVRIGTPNGNELVEPVDDTLILLEAIEIV